MQITRAQILDKKKLKRKRVGRFGSALDNVKREIAIWKKLSHKHCVQLYEVRLRLKMRTISSSCQHALIHNTLPIGGSQVLC